MKRKILFAVALLATMTAAAQNIAAVSPSNATTIFQTLDEAIAGAESGSTIYLPGGVSQIKDETKINKKLTIMGVSHRGDTDNVDGATIINGNLWFNEGSSGSAVLGCYITGDVNIADNGVTNDVVVKLCNINSVQVKNEKVTGTFINQNYIRNSSGFSYSSCTITNNVMHSIHDIKNGNIKYNVLCNSYGRNRDDAPFYDVSLSNILYNILKGRQVSGNYYGFWRPLNGSDNFTDSNIVVDDDHGKTFGDNPIIIDAKGSDCFVEVRNWVSGWDINPKYNYHFKDEYKEYESQVGIYGGTGFKDSALAPIPRIVSKKVDESTDGSGKLHIMVTVKAQ